MPWTFGAAALKRLFTFRPPRCSSGVATATSRACSWMACASSAVRKIWRPARSPPACLLVRPPQTIPMFLPSSRSTCSLPCRNPSPVADRMTTEMIPHRIPNIVRKLRSLFARRFANVWMKASLMTGVRGSSRRSAASARLRLRLSARQHDLVALLQPARSPASSCRCRRRS